MSLHSKAVHGCICPDVRCKLHRTQPDVSELIRSLNGEPSYDALKAENERLRAGLDAAEAALYTLAEWSTAPGGIVAPDHTVCGPKVPLIRFAREARMAAERALAPEHPPSRSKP